MEPAQPKRMAQNRDKLWIHLSPPTCILQEKKAAKEAAAAQAAEAAKTRAADMKLKRASFTMPLPFQTTDPDKLKQAIDEARAAGASETAIAQVHALTNPRRSMPLEPIRPAP